MEFPSKLLENLVYNISQLSGIGKRSALRIALEILRKPKEYSRDLSESIFDFKTKINYCKQCHNISDKEVCDICSNSSRDQSIICVVEDIRDVIAIENTNLYNGLYHVLGGVISPIEGIGPDDLKFTLLCPPSPIPTLITFSISSPGFFVTTLIAPAIALLP